MRNKKEIKIGNLTIGGNNQVIIQSMTNTRTKDALATIKQINNLEKIGCMIVRVSVLDENDALAIKEIKKQINIGIFNLFEGFSFWYWHPTPFLM